VSKITLSVCKVYRNTGRFRFHRKKTKQAWKHYFLSNDYTDEYTFDTEWVDSITAKFLRLKKWHKRKFICPECFTIFTTHVKNDRTKVNCPNCSDEESKEDD